MTTKLVIDYYTDILCVWAWIAQRRNDELNKTFGDKIEWRYHYVDIFGDVANKMSSQWSEKGGFDGFAKHVVNAALPFDDAIINTDIWHKTKPTSSANAHLVLKAAELVFGNKQGIELALLFRKAFFIEAKDISRLDVLFSIILNAGLDVELLKATLNDGRAMAALMNNYQQAKSQNIKGSPSYILDNGRQVLYGNVGYRVLEANIEEQLKTPSNEASWC